MKVSIKILLVVETAVCFAPAVVILTLGMVIASVQVRFLLTRSGDVGTQGALAVIAAVTAGAMGLIASSSLLVWIVARPRKFLSRSWTLAGLAAGAVPLISYLLGSVDSLWWRVAAWLPLLCGAHLMYLARAFLFPPGAPGSPSGTRP